MGVKNGLFLWPIFFEVIHLPEWTGDGRIAP